MRRKETFAARNEQLLLIRVMALAALSLIVIVVWFGRSPVEGPNIAVGALVVLIGFLEGCGSTYLATLYMVQKRNLPNRGSLLAVWTICSVLIIVFGLAIWIYTLLAAQDTLPKMLAGGFGFGAGLGSSAGLGVLWRARSSRS